MARGLPSHVTTAVIVWLQSCGPAFVTARCRKDTTVAGVKPVVETARKMGVAVNTVQLWRAKYGGMTVSEAQEKRRIEEENGRLRQLVAQYALEVDALKAALGKRW